MATTENSLYQIGVTLRRAAYRKAMRKLRYETWLHHGEGQLVCSVYIPPYPKELYEVVGWQPVVGADPALRVGKMSAGETETAHAK